MKKINLEEQKIKSGFKVPEDYFTNLESRIMLQISEEKEIKTIPLFNRGKTWLSMAASFILLASVGIWIYNPAEEVAIPQESIETYLAYQNLNEYYLSDMLTDEDLKTLENNQEIDLQEIENYLSKHLESEIYYYN